MDLCEYLADVFGSIMATVGSFYEASLDLQNEMYNFVMDLLGEGFGFILDLCGQIPV